MDEGERSLSKYFFSEGNYAAVRDVLSHFASQRYGMDIGDTGVADRILDIMKGVYDTRPQFSGDYERYILALNQRVISEVFKHVELVSAAAAQRRAPPLQQRPVGTDDRSDIVKSYNDAVGNRQRALEGVRSVGKLAELRSDVVISRPGAGTIEPESVDGPNNTMEMLARMEADRKRMDEGDSDSLIPPSKGSHLPRLLEAIPEVEEEEDPDTPGGTMEAHLMETAPKRRVEVHAHSVSEPPRLPVPAKPERPSQQVAQAMPVLDSVAALQSDMQDRFESWTESLLRALADVKKDLTSSRVAEPRLRTEVLSSLSRNGGDLGSWLASIPCAARVTHLLIPTTPAINPFGRVSIGGVETLVTPSCRDEAFTRLELGAPVEIQAGDTAIKLLDCLGLPLPVPMDRCVMDCVSQQADSLLIGVKSDHGLRTGDQVRLQGLSGSPELIAQLHRPEGHPAVQIDRRHFQIKFTEECGPVTGLGEAVNMKRQVYVFFDRLA